MAGNEAAQGVLGDRRSGPGGRRTPELCTAEQTSAGCCEPLGSHLIWHFNSSAGGTWASGSSFIRFDFMEGVCESNEPRNPAPGDLGNRTPRHAEAWAAFGAAEAVEVVLSFQGKAMKEIERLTLYLDGSPVVDVTATKGLGRGCRKNFCNACGVSVEPQQLTISAGQHVLKAVVDSADGLTNEDAYLQVSFASAASPCDGCRGAESAVSEELTAAELASLSEDGCCGIDSWSSRVFSKCDWWGDPHYTRTFFGGVTNNHYGIGPWQAASNADGSFQVQNFQCNFENTLGTDVVGVAVKIQSTIVYISQSQVSVNGTVVNSTSDLDGIAAAGSLDHPAGLSFVSSDCCSRANVNVRYYATNLGPPSFRHNGKVRIAQNVVTNDGLCGSPDYLSAARGSLRSPALLGTDDLLFTAGQMAELCDQCTTKPLHCTPGAAPATPTPGDPPPQETPEHMCEEHRAACGGYGAAAEACVKVEGTPFFDGCVLDYCATDCEDPAVLEEAAEEATENHTDRAVTDYANPKPRRQLDASPTKPPSGKHSSLPATSASARDDPHIHSLAQEDFVLGQPGMYSLLRVPMDERSPALLHLTARVAASDRSACAMYIKSIALGGASLGGKEVRVRAMRRSVDGSNAAGGVTTSPFSLRVASVEGPLDALGIATAGATFASRNATAGATRPRGQRDRGDNATAGTPEWIPFRALSNATAGGGERREWLATQLPPQATVVAYRREELGAYAEAETFRVDVGMPGAAERKARIIIAQAAHQAMNVELVDAHLIGESELGGLLGTQPHDKVVERPTEECQLHRARRTSAGTAVEQLIYFDGVISRATASW